MRKNVPEDENKNFSAYKSLQNLTIKLKKTVNNIPNQDKYFQHLGHENIPESVIRSLKNRNG